ncbi:hypothetical protein [Tenacibaculum sp. M341]|uniref:hypothetical protein n=1 Tax=Tenacibaculum sp. M341 TaxID=2530339 RepID=UPI0010472120|nr:hypothetical protein [Tenacibaculum sp. M341]TCI92093.1 hypothetical protein EYW44_07880 [Tenacibaculum sp. M341]
MKTIQLFYILTATFFMFNCSTNEELVSDDVWHLVTIDGGLSPATNYSKGEITWFFNTQAKTITIKNSVSAFVNSPEPFTSSQSGVYNYTIEKRNDIDYLIVGSREGAMKFTAQGLEIDYGIAHDDVRYTFIK